MSCFVQPTMPIYSASMIAVPFHPRRMPLFAYPPCPYRVARRVGSVASRRKVDARGLSPTGGWRQQSDGAAVTLVPRRTIGGALRSLERVLALTPVVLYDTRCNRFAHGDWRRATGQGQPLA